MKKIKTIIIDDESLARSIIKEYSKEIPQIEIVAEAQNGFEGVKLIQQLNPDLIFLDIQMPKLNGFEMLELLENVPQVIFTTAYDEYAIKAFEINAADYLLKPFSMERFSDAVKKVVANPDQSKQQHLSSLFENALGKSSRIIVKEKNELIFIEHDDIMFVEAMDDYVAIHTSRGKYLKKQTLTHFENILPQEKFSRVHRSFIISLKQMKKIYLMEKGTHEILMSNGSKIPVSKSGYQSLKNSIEF